MDIYEGLENDNYDRKYKDSILIKRILKRFIPFRMILAIIIAIIIVISTAEIAFPIIIAKVIDTLVVENNMVILTVVFALILVGAVKWICNYFKVSLTSKVIGKVVLELREQIYKAMLNQDLSFFDQQRTGKIVSRIMNDTNGIGNVVNLMIELFSYIFITVLLTIWLFRINKILTFILLAMMVLAILLSVSFRVAARRISSYARKADANISSVIQESISGILISKVFRQEKFIYEEFYNSNRQNYKINIRRGLIYCIIYPLMAVFSGVGIAVLIYVGNMLFQYGELTPGAWVLFIQTEAYFWYPMMKIASFWSMFQDGLAASERVFSLFDSKPKVVQTNSETIEGDIDYFEFKKVCFGYDENKNILEDFNLKIKKGEKIALVGQTGAGKTSILRLLARYNEYQSGSLLVNGISIRDLDIHKYRDKLGIISQNAYLFSGTVRENIRYGNQNISDDQIDRVSMGISKGEWLEDLPNGLDTYVGEGGVKLSAGQRQLVALVRVIIKNAQILILDEATAKIDSFTEAQLQDGLNRFMKNQTVIMVAHRISTINHADRIIVIDNGKIAEDGSRQKLLDMDGIFTNFYNKFYGLCQE